MLRHLRQALLALSFLGTPLTAFADCNARDFLQINLPEGDPLTVALEMAYPGLRVDGGTVTLPSGLRLPLGPEEARAPKAMLTDGTIREQFHYVYPLQFASKRREIGWYDPGRVRNDAFFRGLYFEDEATARASLEQVAYQHRAGKTRFRMTNKHGVACQLAAAFEDIGHRAVADHPSLRDVGGSFNWRKIAGTNRLSAHSFGIALDLNTKYGGYWRWAKEPEGQVGPYRNGIPEDVVTALERYGFIWGGKWHHYDGMHFEYRPELILYARMVSGAPEG